MSGTTKKKNCAVLFPILEEHLVEWVDCVNEQHVVVSDDVLRTSTEELISILITHLSNSEDSEDYTDFAMSNGWLSNSKNRHGLRCRKTRGDGGGIRG